jgi:hypothetical protein
MADRMNWRLLGLASYLSIEEVSEMAARMRKGPDGRYCVSVSYEDSAGVTRRHYVYGSSIAITADIYGHLTDEASQAAAVTVSAALRL